MSREMTHLALEIKVSHDALHENMGLEENWEMQFALQTGQDIHRKMTELRQKHTKTSFGHGKHNMVEYKAELMSYLTEHLSGDYSGILNQKVHDHHNEGSGHMALQLSYDSFLHPEDFDISRDCDMTHHNVMMIHRKASTQYALEIMEEEFKHEKVSIRRFGSHATDIRFSELVAEYMGRAPDGIGKMALQTTSCGGGCVNCGGFECCAAAGEHNLQWVKYEAQEHSCSQDCSREDPYSATGLCNSCPDLAEGDQCGGHSKSCDSSGSDASALQLMTGMKLRRKKSGSGSAKQNGSFKAIWETCIKPLFSLNFAGYAKQYNTKDGKGYFSLTEAEKKKSQGSAGSDCGAAFDVFVTSVLVVKMALGNPTGNDTVPQLLSAFRKFALAASGCFSCLTGTVGEIKGKKQEGATNKKGCLKDIANLFIKWVNACYAASRSALELLGDALELDRSRSGQYDYHMEDTLSQGLDKQPDLNDNCSPKDFYNNKCFKTCEPECDCDGLPLW
jgi:hypothetical protein